MPFRARGIVRELGTALAVVALYLLVLLAPLHQAAGLQRDLAALGYQNQAAWSVCGALAQDEDGNRQPGQFRCALAGIAKNDVLSVSPLALDLDIVRASDPVVYATGSLLPARAREAQPGQARAPPVPV